MSLGSLNHAAFVRNILALIVASCCAFPAAARDKQKLTYGEGLIVNIPVPVAEVTQVVQDVVQNGIIRGSKEYNKDEYITHAIAAS